MILFPSLLILATPGVRVDVVGAGQLRFAQGRTVVYATRATLSRSAAGLLADAAGRPVVPQISMPKGSFAIGMGGRVTAGGQTLGQLILERPGTGGDFGFPGTGTFGLLRVASPPGPCPRAAAMSRPTVATRPLVRLHPVSAVAGDRATLGDMAEIVADPATAARLKAIDLGTLPPLGSDRTIMKYSVLAALRDQGFPEGTVDLAIPPDAKLMRRCQTIDAARILDAATKTLDPNAKGGDVPFDMGPRSLVAEPGEVTFSPTIRRSGDRAEVTLEILVDGKVVGERTVRFTQKREGVRQGDAVRVTVAVNGALVETDAKARTGGIVGETVQIVTADGATLTATVTGNGKVQVTL